MHSQNSNKLLYVRIKFIISATIAVIIKMDYSFQRITSYRPIVLPLVIVYRWKKMNRSFRPTCIIILTAFHRLTVYGIFRLIGSRHSFSFLISCLIFANRYCIIILSCLSWARDVRVWSIQHCRQRGVISGGSAPSNNVSRVVMKF